MWLETLLVIAGTVLLTTAGFRDLRVLFAAQVAALVANVLLPFSVFGLALTSQRLVALVAILVCGVLFLTGRLNLPWPTASQGAFLLTYGLIVVIHAWHILSSAVVRPLQGLLSAILNAVLFYLVLAILHNIGDVERRKLFFRWLPWIVFAVLAPFIASWCHEILSRPALNMDHFSQEYRLRNTGARNIVNVWAAALVLTVPLVWLPLFRRQRLTHTLASIMAVAIASVAIGLTFSRAALFGLLALLGTGLLLTGVGLIAARRERTNPGWSGIAAPAAGSLFVTLVTWMILEWWNLPVASWFVERVRPLFSGTDRSLQLRLEQLRFGLEKLRDLPLLGYGPESAAVHNLPENTLLLVSLYYGPLALLCLVGMLLLIGRRVTVWWWHRRRMPEAVSWPSAYVAFVVLLLTNDFLFFSMGSLLLATITFYTTVWDPTERESKASYSAT